MKAHRPVVSVAAVALGALIALAPTAAFSQPAPGNVADPDDAAEALALVYGASPWADKRLAGDAFTEGRAYIEPLFDRKFIEDGIEKRLVIATLTPRPTREYSCNACTPLIGGALFRRDGAGWAIEARGEIIAPGSSRGASLELVEIGPGRHAVLHRVETVSGGYETKRSSIIFAHNGVLAARASLHITETPGPGACALPKPQLSVRLEPGATPGDVSGYYDLVVETRYNNGACREHSDEGGATATFTGEVCKRVERYAFRDGNYVPLRRQQSECTPLVAESSLKG